MSRRECPQHAGVSYYDPEYRDAATDETARRPEVETLLKPCVRDGHLRFDTARRSPTCWTPVLVEAPAGIDLS